MKLLRNLKGFKQILYVFHYFNQNGEYSNKKFLFTWFNELFGDQSLDSPVFNDSSFFFFWWWICKFSWFLKSIFTNIDIHFFTVNVRHNVHRSSVWEFYQHFPILLDFFWVIKVTGPWSTYIYCCWLLVTLDLPSYGIKPIVPSPIALGSGAWCLIVHLAKVWEMALRE